MNYKNRIKSTLRPIFIPFNKEHLLDKIANEIARAGILVDALDNRHPDISQIKVEAKLKLDKTVNHLRDYILQSMDGNKELLDKYFEAKGEDYYIYDILEFIIDKIIMSKIVNYTSKYDCFKYNVPPFPDDRILYFSSVRQIMDEGVVEIGVPIGPEGFIYAALFNTFGLPMRDIIIDEYDPKGGRPYRELDDLNYIKGKNVLFIEDDVITGKTLERAYLEISKYYPKSIYLYLGLPKDHQHLDNIPKGFKKIYIQPSPLLDEQRRKEVCRALHLFNGINRIFKERTKLKVCIEKKF